MTPLRVVVADDHPMFRYGLRAALAAAPEVEVVGECADGLALADLVERVRPDVVLTDVDMPAGDGVTATAHLLVRQPGLPVLVLTMHSEDDVILAALRAGARGYLLKGADRDEIVRAILTVAEGGTVYGAGIGNRVRDLLTHPAPPTESVFPSLAPRENEVLREVAHGQSNHEIARLLGLSEKTVRNNVATILTKLAVPSRAAAVARARDAGL